MSPTLGFLVFLGVTLAFLGAVVLSGRAARRRIHLPCVAGALVSLGVTIYFAEQLGDGYDLESAGLITPLHLTLAKLTTACYLLPLVTGPLTLRRPAAFTWHRRFAYLVLLLTVLTAVTGTWMVLASEPLVSPT